MDSRMLNPRKNFTPSPSSSRASIFSAGSAEDILDHLHEFPLVPPLRSTEPGEAVVGKDVLPQSAEIEPRIEPHNREDGHIPRAGLFEAQHVVASGMATIPASRNGSHPSRLHIRDIPSSSKERAFPPFLDSRPLGERNQNSTAVSSSNPQLALSQLTTLSVGTATPVAIPIAEPPASSPYTVQASPRRRLNPDHPHPGVHPAYFSERRMRRRSPNASIPHAVSLPPERLSPIVATSPTSPSRRSPAAIQIDAGSSSLGGVSQRDASTLLYPAPQPASPILPRWPSPSKRYLDDAASDFSWEARSTHSGLRTPSISHGPTDSPGFWPSAIPNPLTPSNQEASTIGKANSAPEPISEAQSMQDALADALHSIHAKRSRSSLTQKAISKSEVETPHDFLLESRNLQARRGPPSPPMSVFSALEDDLVPDFLNLGNPSRAQSTGVGPSAALPTVFENTSRARIRPHIPVRTAPNTPRARIDSLEFERRNQDDIADPIAPPFVLEGPRKSHSISELTLAQSTNVPPSPRPRLHPHSSEAGISHIGSQRSGLREHFSNSNEPARVDVRTRVSTKPTPPVLSISMRSNDSVTDVRRLDACNQLHGLSPSMPPRSDLPPPLPDDSSSMAMLFDEYFTHSRDKSSTSGNSGSGRNDERALRDSVLLPDFQLADLPARTRAESHSRIYPMQQTFERSLHHSASSSHSLRRQTLLSSYANASQSPVIASSSQSAGSHDGWAIGGGRSPPGSPASWYPNYAASGATKIQLPGHPDRGRFLRQHGDDTYAHSRQSSQSRRGTPSIRSDMSGTSSEPTTELRYKISSLLRPTPDLTLSHTSTASSISSGRSVDSGPRSPLSPVATLLRRKDRALDCESHAQLSPTGISIPAAFRPKKSKKSSEELNAKALGMPSHDELVSFMPDENKTRSLKKRLFGKGLGW